MAEVKTKFVKMLCADKGAPFGHTVVDYAEGWTGPLPVDLADAFIRGKSAEEIAPEGGPIVIVPAWPPSDEEIEGLSFSALGVLLEQKGAALGPLKSEDARRAALREIIVGETVAPWPAGQDEGKIPDAKLAAWLRAKGVDISTLKTREEAEAKLREFVGTDDKGDDTWPPSDEAIDAMDTSALATLLQSKGADVSLITSDDQARLGLRNIIAAERDAAAANKQA